ncbi:MAG: DivIVA domain-containing protein, partial [Gemmatimonadota bacterium]|nr:DivIVA domain-containing protein [Gemmatimonadota bacterium]
MIDLTPLDVRNKRGDFKKGLRGYETQEVDSFLEIVSERLEALVRENMVLKERLHSTQEQLNSQSGREKAVQEALVTAQELRTDIRGQAQKEAELIRNEAQADARRVIKHAQAQVLKLQEVLAELERRRSRFLKLLRQLLERELDGVEV